MTSDSKVVVLSNESRNLYLGWILTMKKIVILTSDFEDSEKFNILNKLLKTLFPECEIQIMTMPSENRTNIQRYLNTEPIENGKKKNSLE